MIKSLYTAASGMMIKGSDQFDMLANNLANAATPGFRAHYMNQLSTNVKNGDLNNTDVQTSRGARYEDPRPGQMTHSGQDLDLALDGDGFITVETPNGEKGYTRNGRLRMDALGNLKDYGGNLVLGERDPVTGTNEPIVIPPNTAKVTINAQGEIYADDALIEKLSIVKFESTNALIPVGSSLYRAPEGIEPDLAEDVTVMQRYFERSNVSATEEMVRIISSVRSFESYQKVIQAAAEETTKALIQKTGKVG
jgi:flagellar basal-body rod protein FlgF